MKKRTTALVLAMFILIGCFSSISVSAETSGRLLGDTSNDGIITIIDVTMIQRHLAQTVTFDDESTAAGDVDGNSVLEINDATLIQSGR
ncbi:MAG: dockerin type I repeat-containing protein [Ruminococcus sp.]|nr:dockerin type I repeat-containing protein [Ruminococcus sp.]